MYLDTVHHDVMLMLRDRRFYKWESVIKMQPSFVLSNFEAKMATITTYNDRMHGEENRTAQLGKAYKKHCSLAEQHSKLYLQSRRQATATKHTGEQLQSNQGPQSSISNGYRAVLYIATRQSSPQPQSKLEKAKQGIKT